MALATMTLRGLNEYTDGKLFADIPLPAGVDRDALVDAILLLYGECEPLYPEPMTMTHLTRAWFYKNQWSIEKLVKAINVKYDPLNNYDRHEEWSENSNATGNTSGRSDAGETVDTSAFDSTAYQHDTKRDTFDNTTTNSNSTADLKHSGHLFGNIGVTTSQEMLRAELDIAWYNLYDDIARAYASELLLLVY